MCKYSPEGPRERARREGEGSSSHNTRMLNMKPPRPWVCTYDYGMKDITIGTPRYESTSVLGPRHFQQRLTGSPKTCN